MNRARHDGKQMNHVNRSMNFACEGSGERRRSGAGLGYDPNARNWLGTGIACAVRNIEQLMHFVHQQEPRSR
jgi:hypothetical protein